MIERFYSFIIVNYKSVSLTKNAIQSIVSNVSYKKFEVIVIDNNSGDDFSIINDMQLSFVKVIYNDSNSGFGAAINSAVNSAIGDYYILLNPDTLVCSDIPRIFNNFYTEHGSVSSILGGQVISPENTPDISFGNFPSLSLELASLFGLLKISYKLRLKLSTALTFNQDVVVPFSVDYVSGAICCIPKSTFKFLNGFDTDFFLYFEETELQFRHRALGGDVFLVPQAKIIHFVSSITGVGSDFKILNLEFGKYLYFKKTSNYLKLVSILLTRFVINIIQFSHKRKSIYFSLAMCCLNPKLYKKLLSKTI